jgi:hypothetical protein
MLTQRFRGRGMVFAATAAASLGMAFLIAGCQSKADRDRTFTAALDHYYNTKPDCLWSSPVDITSGPDVKSEGMTKDFDALVAAGMIDRLPAAKEHHGRASEHQAEFQLSYLGRANWTADVARSGYGNFCYGHPQVNTIENYQRMSSGNEPQYTVSFRDSIALPAWAQIPAIQKAFPKVASEGNGETDSATLMKNGDTWKVQSVKTAG